MNSEQRLTHSNGPRRSPELPNVQRRRRELVLPVIAIQLTATADAHAADAHADARGC